VRVSINQFFVLVRVPGPTVLISQLSQVLTDVDGWSFTCEFTSLLIGMSGASTLRARAGELSGAFKN
jgi:hypothetical protein